MPQSKLPYLRDLDFGRLDAREEVQAAPELLRRGYFDFKDAAYRIASGDAWALVGPKGAGKSAAFEYLNLVWSADSQKFLTRWELGGFPVADVTRIQVGAASGPSSSRAAWQFLLLLRVFESLMSDQSGSYPGEITRLRKDLVAAGLIGGDDLRTKFSDWTSTTVKFAVAGVGAEGTYADVGATAVQIVEILKRALKQIDTSCRHVIAIDGLDSFFAQSEDALESLAALVDATFETNLYLADLAISTSVVLAIRSDMFSQLPSTDSAKLTDHSVELDWSNRGMDEGNQLWQLVNGKATASTLESFDGRPVKDLRQDYLSGPFRVARWDTIPAYFMAHTRLLPRDLVALLTYLKEQHSGPGVVHESSAREAVKQYADRYFVREIANGLSRILPGASGVKVQYFLEALSALQSRYFRVRDLKAELGDAVSDGDLRLLLRQLFTIGGLGVLSGQTGRQHTNFVFRRTAGGGFSFVAEYQLHNALVVAWNIPTHQGSTRRAPRT